MSNPKKGITSALRYEVSRRQWGHPIAEHSVPSAAPGPLKPWEKWTRREVKMDKDYEQWGKPTQKR
jgi:hypothetical protein